jgi:uncharacterized protein (TIGR03085 family)
VTGYASIERAAIADLMAELGPDAPTLCEGWTTRDLAAHLVTRATRADAAAGIAIRPLAGHTKRVQDRIATRAWPTLLADVRKRPRWALFLDEPLNRTEYFIHHEDVRRAQPGWQPRELGPGFAAALWSGVRTQARLALRRTPATVIITSSGHGSIEAGRGGPLVDLVGPPGELLLFLSGRQEHASVELAGPADITNRMWTARFGV